MARIETRTRRARVKRQDKFGQMFEIQILNNCLQFGDIIGFRMD